jgi:hypothetical protein
MFFFFLKIWFIFSAQGVVEHKTKTINNSTDPEWNEVCLRDFFVLVKISFVLSGF